MTPLGYFTRAPLPAPTAQIWRFRPLNRFQDIVQSGRLHFARADRFPQDENEGIPPDRWIIQALQLDPFDRESIDNHVGRLAQDRQNFHLSCWYHVDNLEREEPWAWRKYGYDGVALCSRYDLLSAAVPTWDFSDASTPIEPSRLVGLVRYGEGHLEGHYNLLEFLTSKRDEFRRDNEFRIGLWSPDPIRSNNRHYNLDNRPHRRPLEGLPGADLLPERMFTRQPEAVRPRVDLATFVTEIVVSPYAADGTREQVEDWLNDAKLAIPVRDSWFRSYRSLLMDLGDDRYMAV